jgi:hypothetical protein
LPRVPPELGVEADFDDQEVAVRLPRMTTRRWMVAVAVVGLVIGGTAEAIRLKRRHDYFVIRARRHASAEAAFRSWAQTSSARSRHILASISRNLDYHADMARKYGHAARFPWLSVEPDPEEPEWPLYELIPQSR